MSRRILQLLLFIALVAGLALTGYWLILTSFMVYDDEGYVLWSLRMYGETGGLYDQVFSQYGPFFYTAFDGLRRILGLTFNNDTGRLITLAFWLIVSLMGGALTGALTRSRMAAAAATTLTFVGLVAMIREPIHPGGLVALVAMGGAAFGARALVREQPVAFAVATGSAGAALALTKINTGAFFLVAAGSWMLMSTRPGRSSGWVVALGCMLSPWLLMRALWQAPWVNQYALIFACGAVALVPALLHAARPEHGRKSWFVFVGTGLAVSLVTLAVVGARGSSLNALWHGMVVAPLSHPGVYFFPVVWLPGSGVLALLSLGACALVQRKAVPLGSVRLIAGARLVLGLWFLAGVCRVEDEGLTRFALSYGPALAWLMALPLIGSSTSGAARARLWLAWVFVWQTLHAYPVAGSQIAWGTFLWATLLVTGLAEALAVLSGNRAAWRAIGLTGTLAAALIAAGRLASLGHGYYVSSEPLGLPGATSLRPPPDVRRQLRALNNNLEVHTDTLFSLPGLFSLNIWSERPTPTGSNVTHWFSLLSEAEQHAIITRLQADPRAGLVVHRYLLDYLHKEGFSTQGPLRTYLDTTFALAASFGYYEFHVRHGRTIALLSTASLVKSDNHSVAAIEVVIAPTNGTEIAAIALRPLRTAGQTIAETRPTATRPWRVQPLAADGTAAGDVESHASAFLTRAIARITIPISTPEDWSRVSDMCVVVLDASGTEITSALFVH